MGGNGSGNRSKYGIIGATSVADSMVRRLIHDAKRYVGTADEVRRLMTAANLNNYERELIERLAMRGQTIEMCSTGLHHSRAVIERTVEAAIKKMAQKLEGIA